MAEARPIRPLVVDCGTRLTKAGAAHSICPKWVGGMASHLLCFNKCQDLQAVIVLVCFQPSLVASVLVCLDHPLHFISLTYSCLQDMIGAMITLDKDVYVGDEVDTR